ncbi:zinc ribbon domain-containing protein [Streptomyces sp. CS014]|uniref:NADase-type glycan-binding domain-containing protein n=1 Tax=Streptomyces sp. CS014 TaxID=2162707 RepID=UPI00194EECF9|nr:zinc ribbon domain-containing protein [Streptomyces sp. CS014]
MRSCPACGTANGESDDFCGNCGSYLGWSSEPVRPGRAREPEPVPEPEPEPESTPKPESVLEPARDPGGIPAGMSEPESVPEPAPEPTANPAANPPVNPAAEAEAPAPGAAPDPGPPARPEVPARPGQPPEADPADEPIGAVRPGKPVARRPVVRPVAADEAPDGPPCPACGTPNLPGRKFCRRCAAPLRVREQPAALPWWRTMWPFRRRVRGGSGRALRRTLLVLAVAGLVLAGFLFFPLGRYVFEDVRDKLGGTAEISPTGVTASAAAPGHPASAAIDGLTNKYWGAPALGASLTCSFGTPFRLVGIVVHTGVSKEPQEFRRGARPTRADLLVTTEDGKVHRKTVTFTDKPGKQTVRMGISDVRSVELVLREAAGQGEGRPVAVGEVEFFRRT